MIVLFCFTFNTKPEVIQIMMDKEKKKHDLISIQQQHEREILFPSVLSSKFMIIDIVQHVHTSPFALLHLKAKSTNE